MREKSVNMILIDMEMPNKCIECRFSHKNNCSYANCSVSGEKISDFIYINKRDPETGKMYFSEDLNVIFSADTEGRMNVKIRSNGKPDRFIINPRVSLWTGAYDGDGKRIYEDDLVSYRGKYPDTIKVFLSTGCDTHNYNTELSVVGNTSEGIITCANYNQT